MSEQINWQGRADALRADVARYEKMQRDFKRAGDVQAWTRVSNALVGMRDLLSVCEDRAAGVAS